MAAINFPDNPSVNDEFTSADRTWIWDGVRWLSKGTIVGVDGQDGSDGASGLYTPSDTPPENPVNGQPWVNTANGNLFIYWDSFWIQAVGTAGPAGVVAATTPLSYNGATQTVSVQTSPSFSGQVKKPDQVHFHATGPSWTGTTGTIPYSIANRNVGNGYNTTNYRFTAPTAGVYHFSWQFFSNGGNAAGADFYINGNRNIRTGREYADSSYISLTNSIQVYLNANDYCFLQVYTGNLHINQDYSHFSGYLLG